MNNLASEILNIIVLLIKDDQKSLTQLSLVSKALHYITTPILYQSPSFQTINQLHLFTTTLTHQQGSLVKTIDLRLVPHRWQIYLGHIVEDLLPNTTNVQHLDLSLCNINIHNIAAIIRHHRSLQSLSISRIRHVTDDTISTIVEHLFNLIELDISGCNVTDESIYTISKYCPNLESLDISGCDQISEEGIRFLTSECKRLRYINIKDCYNFVPMVDEEDDYQGIISNDGWVDDDDDD